MPKISQIKDSGNPLVHIRKLFVDFGYNKITKCVNAFYMFFHTFVMLLQIYFMIDNFSVELITRYAPPITVLLYMLAAMIFAVTTEDENFEILHIMETSFWSIDSAGPEVQSFILKKFTKMNLFFYVNCTVIVVFMIVMCPLIGSHKEWLLAEIVFDRYLPSCSRIFYHLYFWSIPFMGFTSLRHSAVIFYEIGELFLQIILIKQQILRVCVDHFDFDRLKIGEKIIYQKKIFKALCSCTTHHATLLRVFKKMSDMAKMPLLIFGVLGVLAYIGLLFLYITAYEDASFALKLRLWVSAATVVIMASYCYTGQTLIDESSCVFDCLAQCSWHNWDAKNKQILLIFMANCVKPCSLAFAGIVLNYNLAVSMLRTACSYALVLYNLRSA